MTAMKGMYDLLDDDGLEQGRVTVSPDDEVDLGDLGHVVDLVADPRGVLVVALHPGVGEHDDDVDAVRELPMGQRQLVTLALEGLSYAEMAEVLDISGNLVGVRLNRARKALTEKLSVERHA